MDKIITDSFTKGCTVTIPAEQYLTLYREFTRLENELEYYKKKYDC